MRNEQLKFQMEMKSNIPGRSSIPVGDKMEGSSSQVFNLTISPPLGPSYGVDTLGFGGRALTGGYSSGGYGGALGGGGGGNWKYRKLDMPIFYGTDPDGWVLRVERYFGFNKLTEEEMLEAAAVAMDGDALSWYQGENNHLLIRRWRDLRMFVLRRFRSMSGGSLYEQWLVTNQTSTVTNYMRKFIITVTPLEGISEDMLLGLFLNGLKEEIKVEVWLLHPVGLEQAMELALRVEERNL